MRIGINHHNNISLLVLTAKIRISGISVNNCDIYGNLSFFLPFMLFLMTIDFIDNLF